ncbi:MAG: galactokinase [Acidimicrobiia bacterium]|nr:galactokinase [Acidimicrobiia bacterium]
MSAASAAGVVATAPGRVNIIGDHTDHTGGFCLPMAIDRWITVTGVTVPGRTDVRLSSADEPAEAVVPLDVVVPDQTEPAWGRYVAAVVQQLRPVAGFVGTVRSTIPAGMGLSSSAALEVACALALGAETSDPVALARLCQAAEHSARGVPTGILDQISSIGGVAGHALLLDCHAVTVRAVALPPSDEVAWMVVSTGTRSLEHSGYTMRTRELARAEGEIGPLRLADEDTVSTIADPVVRARARHVVTENARVHAFAAAITAGDVVTAGRLMDESHVSLRDDFESSTRAVDELWGELVSSPAVLGARITGGGWGGAVIALCRAGTSPAVPGWEVRPVDGASRHVG